MSNTKIPNVNAYKWANFFCDKKWNKNLWRETITEIRISQNVWSIDKKFLEMMHVCVVIVSIASVSYW